MQSAETSFSTDKFIERACILVLVLLVTVTVFACLSLDKIYGLANEVRLIVIPIFGALIYLALSIVNKSLSFSNYIRNAIAAVITLSHNSLSRTISAIKLCLLTTITFNTISTLDRVFNIQNDMQDVYFVSEILLVIIPLAYILLQLRKAARVE